MKTSSLRLTMCTITFAVAIATVVQAQNREKFGISAKAGGVNSVTGRVMVTRVGQEPQLLTAQDDLRAGDRVTSGVDSRAEVLLNPGSYFRVAENSEFELVSDSLEDLRVRLIRGSAIVEAMGSDSTELHINIVTDQARFVIARRGVYRINQEPGSTELLVRKGRVLIGDNPFDVVKADQKVVFSGGSVLRAKLSKKDQDEFDRWSKQRAETLAQANFKIPSRDANRFLARNEWWFAIHGFSAQYSGVWFFNPTFRCFTFLPFYFGWSSPYGPYYDLYYYPYGPWPGSRCCGGGVLLHESVIVRNPSLGSSGNPGNPSGNPGNSTPVNSAPGPTSPASSQAPSRPSHNPDVGERIFRRPNR